MFINVCGSDRVALPEGGWAEGKVGGAAYKSPISPRCALKGAPLQDSSFPCCLDMLAIPLPAKPLPHHFRSCHLRKGLVMSCCTSGTERLYAC